MVGTLDEVSDLLHGRQKDSHYSIDYSDGNQAHSISEASQNTSLWPTSPNVALPQIPSPGERTRIGEDVQNGLELPSQHLRSEFDKCSRAEAHLVLSHIDPKAEPVQIANSTDIRNLKVSKVPAIITYNSSVPEAKFKPYR
jgi:hypothetical protein